MFLVKKKNDKDCRNHSVCNGSILRGKVTIVLEARSDLSNQQYTLAMARQETPNSATAQFFINGRDNATQFDGNYAVFGKLLTGCSGCEKLIDQLLEKPIKPIRFVQFGKEAVEAKNVPVVPIRIISAKILQD